MTWALRDSRLVELLILYRLEQHNSVLHVLNAPDKPNKTFIASDLSRKLTRGKRRGILKGGKEAVADCDAASTYSLGQD